MSELQTGSRSIVEQMAGGAGDQQQQQKRRLTRSRRTRRRRGFGLTGRHRGRRLEPIFGHQQVARVGGGTGRADRVAGGARGGGGQRRRGGLLLIGTGSDGRGRRRPG